MLLFSVLKHTMQNDFDLKPAAVCLTLRAASHSGREFVHHVHLFCLTGQ